MGLADFTFDRRLAEQFVEFGYDLYRDDPNFIPPFRAVLRKRLFSPEGVGEAGGSSFRHFLLTNGNQALGRISAFINPQLRNETGQQVGTVGLFECVDDDSVAEELLGGAIEWIRDHGGVRHIWGPMNFDIWNGYRLMVEGFEFKTFFGEPYNKPYYADFFARAGFRMRKEWDTVEIVGREALEAIQRRGVERYQQILRQGYRFEDFNLREFNREVARLHSILVPSFSGFLGFTPISEQSFKGIALPSRTAILPDLFTFVCDESNTPAGFAWAFPDLSDAIRSMGGSDALQSKVKFICNRRRSERMVFYIGGITPGEAAKHSGLGRAGFYHVMDRILRRGCERVVVALRSADNPSRAYVAGHNNSRRRRYALFELEL